VMLVWFVTIAVLGVIAIVQEPRVLTALDPRHAVAFFVDEGLRAFMVLGSVFLAVTGGEALYADIGHVGKWSARAGWFAVALPALLLNYLGQGALVLSDPGAVVNPFFRLAPAWALAPLVGLATLAAIVASQALISGVFSLTMQAVRLGYLPRLKVDHTSATTFGQVYVGTVNWLLLSACLLLVVAFGTSSDLAAAYGVAVTATMLITSLLLAVVAREVWRWSVPVVAATVGVFVLIDAAFLAANLTKVLHGGWFPLVVAALVFTVMTTWRRGRTELRSRLGRRGLAIDRFVENLRADPLMIGQPIQTHLAGNRLFVDRERPAKTATLVRPVQLRERDALQRLEQIPHLAERRPHHLARTGQPQPAQAVTTLVDAHLIRETASQWLHLQYIDQELAQLKGLADQLFKARLPRQMLAIVIPHHGHAASRGTHDVGKIAENLEKLECQRARLRLASRVGHRLSTAGLLDGKLDLHSQLLQQLRRSHPDVRIQLVNVARNKQADPHGCPSVTQAWIPWPLDYRAFGPLRVLTLPRPRRGMCRAQDIGGAVGGGRHAAWYLPRRGVLDGKFG